MKWERNVAFIDAQNLRMGTLEDNWSIDDKKFRIYLHDKYCVKRAYYFIGYFNSTYESLYKKLEQAGFKLIFKEHISDMGGRKKGNVDTDIIFEMLTALIDTSQKFDKAILVSGDGDYKRVVDYFILKNKFKKILFPNRKFASSLYKSLGNEYFDYLENNKGRIKYIK